MPREDDPTAAQIEEHLVEAQIWDMAPLQAYLPADPVDCNASNLP